MKKGTSNTLTFTYDAGGTPLTVTWNGTKYYYTTNIQGDVVAILNANGTTVASYTYDAWGRCLNSYTSGIGFLNPLRYRGYVYDQQTELYYLQSRYYDPKVGRFLNADVFTTTGQGFVGNNMFAYCNNRPVISVDYSGYDAVILLDEDLTTHIGIMVQDEDGTWWHFYWGTGEDYISTFFGSTNPKTWYEKYEGDITVEAINESGQFNDYEQMCYLYGDFSACVSKIKSTEGSYNLWNNNCSQVSLGILASADSDYQAFLYTESKTFYPRAAFQRIKKAVTIVNFYNKFIFLDGKCKLSFSERRK